MHVAVIGGGIVGTAIAATLQKHHPFTTQVTIIDDKRPHQTSYAGQGYLWSIHRCCTSNDSIGVGDDDDTSDGADGKGIKKSSLEYSINAKQAWIELLGEEKSHSLLQKRGSLLIAPSSSQEQLLQYYDIATQTIPGGGKNLKFLSDASTCCNVLLPTICGIHYQGDDYTCTPPHLINALMEKYSDIKFECRTVTSLEIEKKKYDCIICCTGPWVNELKNNLGVKPIRGILVELEPGISTNRDLDKSYVPMMEFGYGSMGMHFTLSPRQGNWLLGASREEVSFSLENLDDVVESLILRSKEFICEDTLGPIRSRKIGFRPAYIPQKEDEKRLEPFQILHDDDNIVYCYGFEGKINTNYVDMAILYWIIIPHPSVWFTKIYHRSRSLICCTCSKRSDENTLSGR